MAFPPSFLLVAEDNPRVGAPADGAGMHPATSDALDFVPVKSKNRSSHSTSQGRGLEAAGSVEITRASSRLRPDRAGQVGLVRPPARSDLPGSSGGWDSSRRLSCPHSNPTSLTLLPEEITTHAHCQTEVISTGY